MRFTLRGRVSRRHGADLVRLRPERRLQLVVPVEPRWQAMASFFEECDVDCLMFFLNSVAECLTFFEECCRVFYTVRTSLASHGEEAQVPQSKQSVG